MIGWIVLIVILVILTKFSNYFRSVILALQLSGPPALPVFGNVLTILDGEELLQRSNEAAKYQPLCRVWCFILPIFVVYEPEHVKIIMANTKVSDKNFFYRIMHGFIGDGLITSTGDKWKTHRKHIQPFFQANFLETYCEDFTRITRDCMKSLHNVKCVKMTSFINLCVLKILHKIVLGVDLQSEFDTPFRKSELFVIKRVLQPWLLLDSVFKQSTMSKHESEHTGDLHLYVEKILNQRSTNLHQGSCLLDKIMSLTQKGFSKEDVINEAVTFLLAGHDSVASAIVFSLYHLAKHQDVQRRVYEEVKKEEIVSNMPFLEQCIKETLRLYPSIPLLGRKLLCDVTLGKHTLPKGTNLFIAPLATHRQPHLYPNPLKYDPERFSLENSSVYGYYPFSVGPRNCIGQKFALMEMKTVISLILREYRISLRNEKLKVGYKVTLRASGGMWMNLEKHKV